MPIHNAGSVIPEDDPNSTTYKDAAGAGTQQGSVTLAKAGAVTEQSAEQFWKTRCFGSAPAINFARKTIVVPVEEAWRIAELFAESRTLELQRQLEEEASSHLVTLDDRDSAEDALQKAHIALGGDGEWVTKFSASHEPAGCTGDLRLDVPHIAAQIFEEAKYEQERAEKAEAELTRLRQALMRMLIHWCGDNMDECPACWEVGGQASCDTCEIIEMARAALSAPTTEEGNG